VKFELLDLEATIRFGAAIAEALRPGDIVALSGGLGAGKTTLARSIIAALGYAGEVPSPTFAIIEVYEPPMVRLPVVHADFYRLESPEDVEELGLDDYLSDGALIAEWPENAGGFVHDPACISIRFEIAGKAANSGRIAIVEPGADWVGRMPCP
jgi:tRNA threonylcarbamoyladenosine biosynthesis protein TsaE